VCVCVKQVGRYTFSMLKLTIVLLHQNGHIPGRPIRPCMVHLGIPTLVADPDIRDGLRYDDESSTNLFQPPSTVMQTGIIPLNVSGEDIRFSYVVRTNHVYPKPRYCIVLVIAIYLHTQTFKI
jgi:hypothetical protein